MNIRDLRYIVTVAREKHFCKAAEICNVSQPALSGQIRKLEDRLGVPLFERSNRKVYVTEAGEVIVEKAKDILKLTDDITAAATSFKNPYSGTFKLGIIQTIAPYLTPLILQEIRRAMPALKIVLVEGLTDELEQKLDDAEIDAIIMATIPKNQFFDESSLYFEPFWIAMSSDHPLSKEEEIEICDIDLSDLHLLADGHCLRSQVLNLCNNIRNLNLNTMRTSLETILALIESGDGLTLIPSLAIPKELNNRPGLVVRREKSGEAGRDVVLVSRKTGARKEILHKISEIIKRSVPDESVLV